jgi:hypothetical protein
MRDIFKNTLDFLDIDRCNIKIAILEFIQKRPIGSRIKWNRNLITRTGLYVVSRRYDGRNELLPFTEKK